MCIRQRFVAGDLGSEAVASRAFAAARTRDKLFPGRLRTGGSIRSRDTPPAWVTPSPLASHRGDANQLPERKAGGAFGVLTPGHTIIDDSVGLPQLLGELEIENMHLNISATVEFVDYRLKGHPAAAVLFEILDTRPQPKANRLELNVALSELRLEMLGVSPDQTRLAG